MYNYLVSYFAGAAPGEMVVTTPYPISAQDLPKIRAKVKDNILERYPDAIIFHVILMNVVQLAEDRDVQTQS